MCACVRECVCSHLFFSRNRKTPPILTALPTAKEIVATSTPINVLLCGFVVFIWLLYLYARCGKENGEKLIRMGTVMIYFYALPFPFTCNLWKMGLKRIHVGDQEVNTILLRLVNMNMEGNSLEFFASLEPINVMRVQKTNNYVLLVSNACIV